MKIIKEYMWSLLFAFAALVLYFYNNKLGITAFGITFSNLKQMLQLLPPIFILMGLLDVWVPKETLIKYMGHGSGLKGLAIAFTLGTAAAGPLYVAFPIAALLLKKGARLAYVLFFLGVWSSTKLPIVLFEIASLGLKFTSVHISISLAGYLLTSYLIEKIMPKEDLVAIMRKAESI